MVESLIIYYGVLQVIGFYIMGADKRRAQNSKWRIPERRLWGVAILGGGLGLWLGMVHFRHKTKHLNFRLGFPFFTFLHCFLILYLIYSFNQ
jgi:uncharacterized membrane protein YsdA (DUF1294 family)